MQKAVVVSAGALVQEQVQEEILVVEEESLVVEEENLVAMEEILAVEDIHAVDKPEDMEAATEDILAVEETEHGQEGAMGQDQANLVVHLEVPQVAVAYLVAPWAHREAPCVAVAHLVAPQAYLEAPCVVEVLLVAPQVAMVHLEAPYVVEGHLEVLPSVVAFLVGLQVARQPLVSLLLQPELQQLQQGPPCKQT